MPQAIPRSERPFTNPRGIWARSSWIGSYADSISPETGLRFRRNKR
jgi:hypothetical protein